MTDTTAHRNIERRRLFQKFFQRMSSTQAHITAPIIGHGPKMKPIRGSRMEVQKRGERRKLARAFAAGAWKRRNEVSA